MYRGAAIPFISRTSKFLTYGAATAFGGVCLLSKFVPTGFQPSSYTIIGGLIGLSLQTLIMQKVIREYVYSAQIDSSAQNPDNHLTEIETRSVFGRPNTRTMFVRDLERQSILMISRISGRKFFFEKDIREVSIKKGNDGNE